MRASLESGRASTRVYGAAALALVSLLLAACSTAMGPEPPTAAIMPQAGQTAPTSKAPVTIALLLPLEGMGESAALAKSLKQAAEMALFERNDPSIQLVTKDDRGTAAGARAAADAALKDGAEIILGPLLSPAVGGAAPEARKAGVPVLAFSNDVQVAGNGVYLLSYLAEQEVDRIITFAAGRGKRRFAALVPDDAYGNTVEAAFRAAVARTGGAVSVVERYPRTANGMLGPTKRVVEAIKRGEDELAPVDALFLPGGRDALPQIGPVLAYSGLDTTKVKLLGTGAWDIPSLGRDDAYVGGWYPSPDPMPWRSFAERFARTFGSAPPRLASVAYDAVGIAISLSANPAGARFTVDNITRPQGFAGVDGIVRFDGSGLCERGLAILEVQKFGAAVVDPAPAAFGPTRMSAAETAVR